MATQNLSYTSPGNVTSTNVEQFWQSVEPLIAELSPGDVLDLDLRVSRIIDSVGLNVIVKVIREANKRSARVRVRVGSESLRRLCRFTRLDQHAEIVGP